MAWVVPGSRIVPSTVIGEPSSGRAGRALLLWSVAEAMVSIFQSWSSGSFHRMTAPK